VLARRVVPNFLVYSGAMRRGDPRTGAMGDVSYSRQFIGIAFANLEFEWVPLRGDAGSPLAMQLSGGVRSCDLGPIRLPCLGRAIEIFKLSRDDKRLRELSVPRAQLISAEPPNR